MFEFKGIEQINLKLDKMRSLSDTEVYEKLAISTNIVADEARKVCPVRTGELKRSIHATNPVKKPHGYEASVRAEKFYAIYVELGTRFFAPRAFMRRGMRNAIAKIKEVFSRLRLL